ncbi:MAG: rRNA pseudouridine synthase [Nostocales cyanobacterium]|nr:MAG: rRNA pseudouridine synthase [Nostocales cyanobacterium]TAF12346.1 MAG: rRNA pseudouridine synthase [Nostocales cyanobacterium]
MEARVQKIISQWGVASRREAEEMIKQSRVHINGTLAHLGQKVDPHTDTICVDGKPISARKRPDLIYLLLNKPAGVVSTCDDPQGRTTVLHLLPPELQHGLGIHPVGRLDADSTGALILTNDGDLTFALTHPRHNISKTYKVIVQGHPPEAVLKMWRKGVLLEGRLTRPAQVRLIERFANQSKLEIILQEGRNRQIRLVAEQLGYPVHRLHRVAIGSVKLQTPKTGSSLSMGEYRHLTPEEIIFLKNRIKRITISN